eukprot:s2195_g16.t1
MPPPSSTPVAASVDRTDCATGPPGACPPRTHSKVPHVSESRGARRRCAMDLPPESSAPVPLSNPTSSATDPVLPAPAPSVPAATVPVATSDSEDSPDPPSGRIPSPVPGPPDTRNPPGPVPPGFLSMGSCPGDQHGSGDSRVECFFCRLVGDWDQAQRLGNYWREHYNVATLPIAPVEGSHPVPDPSDTTSAQSAPTGTALADTSTLDPATVYAAHLLTTLRSFPQPATPQETRDQMAALLADAQPPALITAGDLSFLGDLLHQLSAFVASQTAEMCTAGMELTPAEERFL